MQDYGTIMDVDEPVDDEAEGGTSLVDVPDEGRDRGSDGTADTPETTSRSHTSQSERSCRLTSLLGNEMLFENTQMTLDPFMQGQPPGGRQQFEQPSSGTKYAPTRPSPQEAPMLSRLRPSTKEPFPVESWSEVTNSRALVEHLLSLYFCWSIRRSQVCPCNFSWKTFTKGDVDTARHFW